MAFSLRIGSGPCPFILNPICVGCGLRGAPHPTLPHLCSCLSSPHRVFASLDHGQVSSNIDNFLSLMPEGVVEAATAQILEENALNEKEYQSEDGDNNVINPITLKDIK